MGIPVFFKTLIQDYNHICYDQKENINIDNLYFDLNCLIHPCCRNLTDETEMHKKILDSIHKIIDIVKPNEMVYIAIDGPCPKPKMIQQRLRRYNEQFAPRNGTASGTSMGGGSKYKNKNIKQGPNGGEYYIKGGRKVYIKKKRIK